MSLATRNWDGVWGEKLPWRGRKIARLLNECSNVTTSMAERKDYALELAELAGMTPHKAWRLAHDTRIALGFGPTARHCYEQIVNREPPDMRWPSAEDWLVTAGLNTEGYPQWQPDRDRQ